jgi:endonuclease-3
MAIFRRLKAANPSPTTELLHATPFELLVAVMLSAHTTDKSVNAATRVLFPLANTPAAIAALGIEGVKPYIKNVGLYNTKAKNLVGLAQQITERHGGEVPGERAALEALPGVGRKTASIILNMVFGEAEIWWTPISFASPTAPGSRPAGRRCRRTGSSSTPRRSTAEDAHHWLLLHRATCARRAPGLPDLPDPRPGSTGTRPRRSRRAPSAAQPGRSAGARARA